MTTSASSRSAPGFASTCWSLVMQRDPSQETRAAALGELCARYWYPVYAYLRCSGHEPALAQDIVRVFLGELLNRPIPAQPSPPLRFRDFLLQRLQGFLDGDWRDLPDADLALPSPDTAALEARHRRDNAGIAAPAQAYQHSFACEVLERALDRLRHEAVHSGHEAMYAALAPYLTTEPAPADYEAMAQRLDQRPLALIVALKRLRQRFRELVGRELSDTVESAADLLDEQRTLHGFLSVGH